MYGALWRRLPGPLPVKAVLSVVLLVLVSGLLWFFVFPALEERLPFNDVTVEGAGIARSAN